MQLAVCELPHRLRIDGRRVAAAAVAATSLRLRPDSRPLALWLSDAVLAARMNWPAPAPMLAAHIKRGDLRHAAAHADGASPWLVACNLAYARGAAAAADPFLYYVQVGAFRSAEEAEATFKGESNHYQYSRFGNPTVSMFENRLAALLLKKYPLAHGVRTDKALYDYVQELKGQHMRNAGQLSVVSFDGTLQALRNALLTNVHAPGQFRALTVRNIDAWYPAFEVKEGQKLYLAPDKRVKVW